ncbi:Ig-like domain-containing protein, partial [Paenibacillus sp. MER 99-2]|uniref:Ig-like domain-containing protein n=1 Tax=Paenibacillus sp. MER 99-2 TaxID=2939572 RepID=UPI00203FB680
MQKLYRNSQFSGIILLVFALTFGSLLSGTMRVYAANEGVVTSFNGTLDVNSIFVRPQMPGDVSYDNDTNGYDQALLEKIWYFQEGENSATCGGGNYINCGIWFDTPIFTGTGNPYMTTVRAEDPAGQSYVRNYFYRAITPSKAGVYSITVTPQTTLDDTVLYLYKGSFDPIHPLHNLLVSNDDISAVNDNYLSHIKDVYLDVGVTYYMVMTGFGNGDTGSVYFDVNGPGSVGINDPDVPAVTSVSVTPTTAEVMQGGNQQLSANVTVIGGAAQTVNWSSDDTTNKVTVDENGLVSVALDAEPKAYTITATSTEDVTKSNTATITVTAAPVTPAVTSVTVTPSSADVMQGTQRQLTADVVVVGGAAQTVNWSSNDTTNKVTVDENGLVSVALDAEPKAYTITATSTEDVTKSNNATITVTAAPVTPAVTSVTVTPSSADVMQGTQRQLTADVVVVGGAAQTVNWSSDDTTNKVTVDQNGLVSVELDAEPKAYTITATSTEDETKSNTATITVTAAPVIPVTPAVTSVTVAPSSAEVTQGTQRQLTADVEVVGGAAQTVDWSSDDTTNKVTVDENGLVSVALDAEPKVYTITATSTEDETKSNTATITVTAAPVIPVTPAVTSVTVAPSSAEVT